MAPFRIEPLKDATWPAFADLVERNGGVFGGCWCMGFHPAPTPAEAAVDKRERKRARVEAGTAHAALVFDGEECVGWAQFGRPDEVPRIKSLAAYRAGLVSLPDWRIACCFVGKGHRRQGVSAAAIAGALGLIADLGGGLVEGYPESAGAVPAGFLFNGALSTYDALGFDRVRMIGKHRWVVSREIAAR
jgi:GNAT superfamily N-acetyltransferase